jgi:hypothetical protein
MRKYRDSDFWFEILTDTAPDGARGTRYYQVSCRSCSNSQRYHAAGVSNEGLKKIFTRAGWTIGKSRFKHICPDCSRRHSSPPTPTPITTPEPPPEPQISFIQKTWLHLHDDQRVEFWHWLHETYACWVDNAGRVSLITQPALPAPAQSPNDSELLAERDRLLAERNDLLAQLEVLTAPAPAPAAPAPAPARASATIIPLRPSPPPAEAPAPDDDDDEPAAWWLEMVAAQEAKKKD